MKRFYSLLLAFIALLATSCSKDGHEEAPLVDQRVLVEVTMPGDVSIEGTTGSIAYYWQDSDKLSLTLIADDEKVSLPSANHKISGDGKKATFEVVVPGKLVNKKLRVSGVIREETSKEGVLNSFNHYLFDLEEWKGGLSFNFRKQKNDTPLYINEADARISDAKLQLNLRSTGEFRRLEFVNLTDAKVDMPKTLTLKTDKARWYKGGLLGFNIQEEKWQSAPSESALVLSLATSELAPNATKQYLLWVPNQIEDTDIAIETERGTTSNKINFSPTLFVGLGENNSIQLSKSVFDIVPADDSQGGDPLFTFKDIKYWVGEGDKMAAFVIEWHDGKEPDALVWGYRFKDESTTVHAMMLDIVKADPRLAVVTGSAMGGFESLFSIAFQPKLTQESVEVTFEGRKLPQVSPRVFRVDFDPRGDCDANDPESKPGNVDKLKISDPNAKWRTGFYTAGYWVFYSKDSRLAPWGYSNTVANQTSLSNGGWYGYSWQETMTSYSGSPFGDKFIGVTLPQNK